jgi:phosphoglycerate dehydrogenase-like enzyme
MTFKMILLPRTPGGGDPEKFVGDDWPEKIMQAVPGSVVQAFEHPDLAMDAIIDADCAYGTVTAPLLARAKKLRWISAPGAGNGPKWFYKELVESDVIVTGMKGIQNEYLSAHIMAFLLSFARRFDHYLPIQFREQKWRPGEKMIALP